MAASYRNDGTEMTDYVTKLCARQYRDGELIMYKGYYSPRLNATEKKKLYLGGCM